ncbi:MAG: hypothetical protein IJH12_10885 [Clostridia bacterium]|nr:hypothetical protein [Clostridia bacterium]
MTANEIMQQFRELYLREHPDTDPSELADIVQRIGLEGIRCNPKCKNFGECEFKDCDKEVAYYLAQLPDDFNRVKENLVRKDSLLKKTREFICEFLQEQQCTQKEIIAWAFNYLAVCLDEVNLFSIEDAINSLPDKTDRDTARELISDYKNEVDEAQTAVINLQRLYSTGEWPQVEQWQVLMYLIAHLCDESKKYPQAVEWMKYAKSVEERLEYYFL